LAKRRKLPCGTKRRTRPWSDEFIAPNYVDHPNLPGLPPGPEGMKQALTYYRAASPQLQATLDDILAEGERVALRWSARGTHLGEWLDVPPTGHHFTMSGISIYRIAQGKAVEGWNSIEVYPTEEEKRWLTEGGGWPGRSGEIPATERDPSPPFWDGLTRNLTWRSRVAEARERERIEQELQVARQIQQALLPEATPQLDGWELTTYYEPAREVGGDFYDFLEFEDGQLASSWGTPRARGCPRRLSWPAPAACYVPSLKPLSRRGTYWEGSTTRCSLTYRPTCSSPASTPSLSPRAADSTTPTQAMICPTCGMVEKQRS
jgi:predicted ester cyclase